MSIFFALTPLQPGVAWADDGPVAAPAATLPPVIITEIVTGTKTSGVQEFIELYNTTDQPIDLTGWQLWYLSAQAADQNRPSANGVIMLGDGADSPIIAPNDYYVLSGRADYLANVARQFYAGTMAATGGNLRLLSPASDVSCVLTVQDQVGWGNALYPAGRALAAPSTGQSAARLLGTDGAYKDTYDNAADFVISATPTPAAANTSGQGNAVSQAEPSEAISLGTAPMPGCTPPPASGGSSPIQQPGSGDEPPVTVVTPPASTSSDSSSAAPQFPAIDVGLVTPQITELLPNTASPQNDATDEFIELYNSNDTPFDLSGFVLQVGTTTKHRYTFPVGTSLEPKSFTSFSSGTTRLALSNTGGQASLLDPLGNVLNQTNVYGAAKEGQVWALANGIWRWSTTPTPGASNIITVPPVATPKKAAAATAKKTAATAKVPGSKTSGSSASKKKTAKTKTAAVPQSSSKEQTAFSPLHPAVLAVVGGFALLYGLYEYRQDVANKFYQLRANRAARRAARLEIEGG
ncbi:MAG TPA: lamin tail domain-containing protein [Candidatus Saccharimonadales bacterium]|nr:lamin tail domain-containing protein [Candidatus Saccharimonadales bacterium]